ncbi:hypothetical protein [Ideonella sp. YS5]|uniref:hypothetical protein n=1 Tax=Ideonella sp. YS5 TaxID=3453714 RepID=UPI003EE94AFB
MMSVAIEKSSADVVAPVRPKVWDRLSAPASLSGSNGKYRLPRAVLLLPLGDDLKAIKVWLETSTSQQTSRRIYRGVMEKFLNWTWLVRGKAVSSLDASDFEAYATFLGDPQPADIWQTGRKVVRDCEAWAPFVAGLKREAVVFNLTVLKSLITWMADVGYARLPFVAGTRLVRETTVRTGSMPRLAPRQTAQVVLDQRDVHLVWSALDLAKESVRTRTQLQFLLQYHCGLKSAEVPRISMGDLRMPDEGPWMLLVPHRPPDLRAIALLPTVMSTLKEYLRDRSVRKWRPLLNMTDSDVEKANRRFFDLAADLCDGSQEDAALARQRLNALKGRTVQYAFAEHASLHGVALQAWQLIGARRQSLPGGLRAPDLPARVPLAADTYARQVRMLEPVLSLLHGPPV